MTQPSHLSLIDRALPILLMGGVILIAVLTLLPFLPAILWGCMLAIAIDPMYRMLVNRFNGRKMVALWSIGIFLLLVLILPGIGLARALLAFLPDALSWLERITSNSKIHGFDSLKTMPAIGTHLHELWRSLFSDTSGIATHFKDELKTVLMWIIHEAGILGVFIFEFSVGILIALILVYRSESVSIFTSRMLDRIGGHFALRLAMHAVMTTRGAVRGVLGAALAQTLVATISYIVAGVPGWIIWAGITFVLSLIQIGPVLVWAPMSIWLWFNGQPGMAIFVFLWGLIIVNLTDNIVRPMLVSKGSNLPAFLAFLGAVGGLLEWGVIGVFLGPVIVAVAYELVLKWIEPETLPEESLADAGS